MAPIFFNWSGGKAPYFYFDSKKGTVEQKKTFESSMKWSVPLLGHLYEILKHLHLESKFNEWLTPSNGPDVVCALIGATREEFLHQYPAGKMLIVENPFEYNTNPDPVVESCFPKLRIPHFHPDLDAKPHDLVWQAGSPHYTIAAARWLGEAIAKEISSLNKTVSKR